MDMRILIVKLSAIGDVVQCLAALNALRTAWPDARITWAVGDAAAEVLRGNPLIDRLLVFPRSRWSGLLLRPGTWPGLFRETHDFFSALRADSYDIALDFQGLLKSGLLIGMCRARRKIGFAGQREGSSLFLNERLPPFDRDEHAVLRYLRLVRHLGVDVDEPAFPLWTGDKAHAEVRNILADLGIASKSIMVLTPGTRWKTKMWTCEGFARVADECRARWGLTPVVVGAPGDRPLARAIQSMARLPVMDLTGRTSLRTLAALYGRSKLVVSTDTGPMHIAAACDVPVVALFGPTAPWRTGPFGDIHRVVRLGLECSPCFMRNCPDPRCMTGITPERVLHEVERCLRSAGFE